MPTQPLRKRRRRRLIVCIPKWIQWLAFCLWLGWMLLLIDLVAGGYTFLLVAALLVVLGFIVGRFLPFPIQSLALSRDGTSILLYSAGTILLLDAKTREVRMTIRCGGGDSYEVTNAVAFAPDGKTIATAHTRNVKLWDAEKGGDRLGFEVDSTVWSMAFCLNGQTLAIGTAERGVVLYELNSGEQRTVLPTRGAARSLAISQDSSLLAASGACDEINVLNLVTGETYQIPCTHSSGVKCLAFSADGTRLATAGFDKSIKICDARDGRELATLLGHRGPIDALAFSPCETLLASGGGPWGPGELKLWDGSGHVTQEKAALRGHTKMVTSVAFAPDGETLISASYDSTLRVWNVHRAELQATLRPRPTRKKTARPVRKEVNLEIPPRGVKFRKWRRGFVLSASTEHRSELWGLVPGCVVCTLVILFCFLVQVFAGEFNICFSLIPAVLLYTDFNLCWWLAKAVKGRVVVCVHHDRGLVFEGVGRCGRRRTFKWSEVSRVSEKSNSWLSRSDLEIGVELSLGKERIHFGTAPLSEQRRHFIAEALKAMLAGGGGADGS